MYARRRLLRFALAGVAAITLVAAASPIDSDELLCEEAVRHLAACCGAGIDRAYDCTAGRGCDDRQPDLNGMLAAHVRDASCDTLASEGACLDPPRSNVQPDLSVPRDLSTPTDFSHPDLTSYDAADEDGGP